jgi:hypothetical protein
MSSENTYIKLDVEEIAQRLGQPRHRKTTNFPGKTG